MKVEFNSFLMNFFSSVESNFKKIRNCIETKKNRVEKNQFFANLCLGDFPDLELIGSEQNNHRSCFFFIQPLLGTPKHRVRSDNLLLYREKSKQRKSRLV